MKVSYDATVDALYVRVSSERIARTVEVQPNLYVDLDGNSSVVGYELLNFKASQREQPLEYDLPSEKELLAAVG